MLIALISKRFDSDIRSKENTLDYLRQNFLGRRDREVEMHITQLTGS